MAYPELHLLHIGISWRNSLASGRTVVRVRACALRSTPIRFLTAVMRKKKNGRVANIIRIPLHTPPGEHTYQFSEWAIFGLASVWRLSHAHAVLPWMTFRFFSPALHFHQWCQTDIAVNKWFLARAEWGMHESWKDAGRHLQKVRCITVSASFGQRAISQNYVDWCAGKCLCKRTCPWHESWDDEI